MVDVMFRPFKRKRLLSHEELMLQAIDRISRRWIRRSGVNAVGLDKIDENYVLKEFVYHEADCQAITKVVGPSVHLRLKDATEEDVPVHVEWSTGIEAGQ